MPRLIPVSLALFGGGVLVVMISMNSQLYLYVSPMTASWIAHGAGAIASLFLLVALSRKRPVPLAGSPAVPWWAYLGGVSGALLVILAVITVNSYLGITGTLVLSIVGQVVFGLFSDHFSWFGLERHPVTLKRLLAVVPIVLGSVLIVFAKGALA